MEKRDFIKDCTNVAEIMKDARGQNGAITQKLIDTYDITLEDLQKNIAKFSKIMSKKSKSSSIKRRPWPVTIYHTLFSSGFGAIFGALAGVGASVLLGGFNPALWSPTLAVIGAVSGAIAFTPPFILKNVKLTKDYRNGKFDNKKLSFTSYLNKRSLKKNKLSTIATANEYSQITEQHISDYVSKILSTNGLSIDKLDFLSRSKRRKLDKILGRIDDCKQGLVKTHSLLQQEKIIDRNLRVCKGASDDELAISTNINRAKRTVQPRTPTVQRRQAPSYAEKPKTQQSRPKTPRVRTEKEIKTSHRQHRQGR